MHPRNLSMLKSKHSDRSLEELEILTFFFFDLLKFMPNPQVLDMIRTGSTPKVGEEFGKISIFAKKRNWKII